MVSYFDQFREDTARKTEQKRVENPSEISGKLN